MQLQLLLQQFVLPECVCRLCLPHSVYLCALHFAFAFACVLLFSCFCFCFCFCFLSFRFVLLLCFFVVVFVLFNIIASTLVHRQTNMVTRHEDHAPHGGQRQHQPHKPHQQHHFLYMYSILCTRARFFFNISAADAICLDRKLDKRLGSRSLSWLWPDWGKLISY